MTTTDKETLSTQQVAICTTYESDLRQLPDGKWLYRDVKLSNSQLHKFAAHDMIEKVANKSHDQPTVWRLSPKTQAWLDDRRTADNDNED